MEDLGKTSGLYGVDHVFLINDTRAVQIKQRLDLGLCALVGYRVLIDYPQLAVFNREAYAPDLSKVFFELTSDLLQRLVNLLGHLRQSDPCLFSLIKCVVEVAPGDHVLAGDYVVGEEVPEAAVVPVVAENHCLDQQRRVFATGTSLEQAVVEFHDIEKLLMCIGEDSLREEWLSLFNHLQVVGLLLSCIDLLYQRFQLFSPRRFHIRL